MEDMIIRPAQTGDADTLARIQTASWHDGFRGILDPALLAAHTDLSRVTAMYRRVLQNPAIRVNMGLVAETPHCLAAWSVNRDGLAEDIAELLCIHSLSDRWRQGYGSAMMAHVLADMDSARFREAVLWVFEENRRARAFYEALGFSAEAALRNDLGAREIRYRKRL